MTESFVRPYAWIHPHLEVRKALSGGQGSFAVTSLQKDELVMVLGGYVFTRSEEERLPEAIRDAALQIERDMVIGVMNLEEVSGSDYVNHSCKPNAGIRGQISLVAMRDIDPGEEITFDYGTVLFQVPGGPRYEMMCQCKQAECRKKITQYDWQLPELQKRYDKYFPYYILDEIEKMKTDHD